jgi:hypothetical protein
MNFTQMTGSVLAAMLVVSGCGAKEPPMQVVYRFDDHRYLELKGWNCEGELWYTDTQRGIHSQLYFQFFRIFTKKFVHPSERYLVIPNWDPGAFRVSKDYGKTWTTATYSPGENEPNGDSSPPRDDILSFTVVNDQGFCRRSTGCICRQSRLMIRAFFPVVRGLPTLLMTERYRELNHNIRERPGAGLYYQTSACK